MKRETMQRFRVDDEVIWKSPYTGDDVPASYRGDIGGRAMIWTGTLQIDVEYMDLRHKDDHPKTQEIAHMCNTIEEAHKRAGRSTLVFKAAQ
jgi:hypothetical protein